jgi:16S rRNA (guanine527-N7)-methyltransferase
MLSVRIAMKPLKGVSRETQDRLETYHALLLKWQAKINLISPGTVPEVWRRHFIDSAQLATLLPSGGKVLYDLGSGGGFPGMVLALLRPDIEVHLVESDEKKCAFLQTVSRETGYKVFIHNARIEGVIQPDLPAPDVVTARALASLIDLLNYCTPWILQCKNTLFLFPKGAQSEAEIAVSREKWDFDLREIPSQTDPQAAILALSNVRKRG